MTLSSGYLAVRSNRDGASPLNLRNATGHPAKRELWLLQARNHDRAEKDLTPNQPSSDGKQIFFVSDIRLTAIASIKASQASPENIDAALSAAVYLLLLENKDFKLTIDPAHGVITSIYDKHNNRESLRQPLRNPLGKAQRHEHFGHRPDRPRRSPHFASATQSRIRPRPHHHLHRTANSNPTTIRNPSRSIRPVRLNSTWPPNGRTRRRKPTASNLSSKSHSTSPPATPVQTYQIP